MRQQLLVIDDSQPIHTLVRALLADLPVDIQSATDGAYGVTLVSSMRPNLILLDIDMPGTNGFETCKKLKADPATSPIPVILTAISSVQSNEKKTAIPARNACIPSVARSRKSIKSLID